MKAFRLLTALFGLALFLGTYLPIAHADEWDKTTKITFKEPVQIPGKVLEPGTYVFKLLNSAADRHIVQIFNEDHTKLITTILAVPNYRLEPAGKTILTYDERPADQPIALAAWFYPGDNFGQEFVYPKSESEQLSRLNKREVPSTGSEKAYPNLKQRNEEVASENAKPAPQAATPPPATAAPPAAPKTAPETANTQVASKHEPQLPHTASMLPLAGLLGLMLLGFAVFLRVALHA